MVGRGDTASSSPPPHSQGRTRRGHQYGAPPVDLVHGVELSNLLAEYGLGVEMRQRTVQEAVVDTAYFDHV